MVINHVSPLKNIKRSFIFFSLLIFSFSCSVKKEDKNVLRLGYMLNVTHGTAIIGIEEGIFKRELGEKIIFKPVHFLVGNSVIDAFITDQIDLAYVGPGPFLNAIYRKVPIELLSNACNRGTLIVGNANSLQQKVIRIAVPQFGNTQDLILRAYLEKTNLTKNTRKENLIVHALPPPNIGSAFYTMSIDAACLPEPWGTILLQKNVTDLLVNEKEILNNGEYSTTLLVVSKKFASQNPRLVEAFVKAHEVSSQILVNEKDKAEKIIFHAISKKTGSKVDIEVIKNSLKRCTFVNSLNLISLKEMALAGIKAGYYEKRVLSDLETHYKLATTP